jgi:hypothetical protein
MEDWNLYLRNTLANEHIRVETHLRIFRAILDREQVITHGLVGKFMNKWGEHIH